MSDIRVCIHCGNAVTEIKYKDDKPALMRADLENKFKHAYPRPYTVCSKNPIMDDDTQWVSEEEYGG